jgi:hypothetical protein
LLSVAEERTKDRSAGVWEEEAGVLMAAVDEKLDDDGWVLEPINWATDQVLPPLLLALDSNVR